MTSQGRTESRSVIPCTTTSCRQSPAKNNAAVCQVIAAVLHTTPMMKNDTGYKSCHSLLVHGCLFDRMV